MLRENDSFALYPPSTEDKHCYELSKMESKHSDPSRSKTSASWWTYPVSTCLSETLFAGNLGVYRRPGDLWQADIWIETEMETVGSNDTLEMK